MALHIKFGYELYKELYKEDWSILCYQHCAGAFLALPVKNRSDMADTVTFCKIL